MILNTLELRNYKQYAELHLEFREGLVGIIGKNGAGKSTLFEAILYCLYGKDELNNKELIRSSFAADKSPVVLQLAFSMGATLYTVRRELRGRKLEKVEAELLKNDQMVAKGATPVNDAIAQILKLDRDAFKRSVFSGQKELTELSDTKGEKRTKMVRKMLGLDNLDDIQTELNGDTRALRNQITGQEQLLLQAPEAEAIALDLKAKNKQLTLERKNLDTELKQQMLLEKQFQAQKALFEAENNKSVQFNQLNNSTTQLSERIAGLQSQMGILQNKAKELSEKKVQTDGKTAWVNNYLQQQKRFTALEEEQRRKTNFDAYQGQIQTLVEPIAEIQNTLVVLNAELAEWEKTEQELGETRTHLAELKAEREQKLKVHQQINADISALDARSGDRRQKMDTLRNIGREGTCPTCFQPVQDAYDSVLKQLQSEIDQIEQEARKALVGQNDQLIEEGLALKVQIEQINLKQETLQKKSLQLQERKKQRTQEESKLKSLEDKVHRFRTVQKQIGEIHFDAIEFENLQTFLNENKAELEKIRQDQIFLQREIPLTDESLKRLDAQLKQAQSDQKTLEKLIKDLDFKEERYLKAKAEFTGFDEILRTQNQKVQLLQRTEMQLKNEIDRLQERLNQHERVKAQIAKTREEIALLEKLSELLKQFKIEILERVSPGISREASALFSRITKGKYESIFVDDNFEFSIADGGVYYPIERFSGGEIDLANFCLRIAITKAIMELSGNEQGLEFLAFDEIFGSQDEERRHEMMLALNFLQEQFRQIYIVSHIESQKDYLPHILEVKNSERGSVVRWV